MALCLGSGIDLEQGLYFVAVIVSNADESAVIGLKNIATKSTVRKRLLPQRCDQPVSSLYCPVSLVEFEA